MAGQKQVFVTGLTETSTTEKDTLGDLRWEGNKCYKYVKYKATAIACIAGRALGYFEDSGALLHEVTMDTSDQAAGTATNVCAGISQAIIPTESFGWIQVKGHATMSIAFTGTALDGDPVGLVGGTVDAGVLDLLITTAANSHCAGYVGDAATFTLTLDCPF